jgi:hypothetical protein
MEIFVSYERGVKKVCLVGIKSRHRNLPTIEEILDIFTCTVLGDKFIPDFNQNVLMNIYGFKIQSLQYSLVGELHQIFESINTIFVTM